MIVSVIVIQKKQFVYKISRHIPIYVALQIKKKAVLTHNKIKTF